MIGHDYTVAAPTSAVAKVVVNGVFLPSANPVRVLAYDQYGDPSAIANIGKILDAASVASGRTYKLSVVSSSALVGDKLDVDKIDVVLFYDQPNATAGTLATVGASIKASLLSFGQSGGVAVVLDGGGGIGEMPSFLTSAGLLDVSAHTTVTAKSVEVVAPADALGIDVLSPYLATSKSVTFTTLEAPSKTAVVVVEEPLSKLPAVIHKVVKKP